MVMSSSSTMTPTASGDLVRAASLYASSDAANSRSISTCAYGPFVSQRRHASSASSRTPVTVTGRRGARSIVVITTTLPPRGHHDELADDAAIGHALQCARQVVECDLVGHRVAQPSVADERGELRVDRLELVARVAPGEHADQ